MSSQHQMLPPAALTDALERARSGGGHSGKNSKSNTNTSNTARDFDGPLSPHPPARAVQLSRQRGQQPNDTSNPGQPCAGTAAAAQTLTGVLASPPPAPPPTPVISNSNSSPGGSNGSSQGRSALPPMLKLGASASASASSTSSTAVRSAGSAMKLDNGAGTSSSSTGITTMRPPPPPPSDLLSRLDAFLPQLAQANEDLLSKKAQQGNGKGI